MVSEASTGRKQERVWGGAGCAHGSKGSAKPQGKGVGSDEL